MADRPANAREWSMPAIDQLALPARAFHNLVRTVCEGGHAAMVAVADAASVT